MLYCPHQTIEAHCTNSTPPEKVAEAVGERRGCRSGCLGRAFDWPYGEHPSGCRRNAESYPHPNPSRDRRIPVVLSLPPWGLFLWVLNRLDRLIIHKVTLKIIFDLTVKIIKIIVDIVLKICSTNVEVDECFILFKPLK